jgi:hypothetical protein
MVACAALAFFAGEYRAAAMIAAQSGVAFCLTYNAAKSTGKKARRIGQSQTVFEFKLCERTEPSQSFQLIHTNSERPKKHSDTRQLPVDQRTYSNLLAVICAERHFS